MIKKSTRSIGAKVARIEERRQELEAARVVALDDHLATALQDCSMQQEYEPATLKADSH